MVFNRTMKAGKRKKSGKRKHSSHSKRSKVGSRAMVWHGTADHTSGGLFKKHLKKNKHGRIVSVKLSATAKRQNRLKDFKTKKGEFKLFRKRKNGASKKRKSKRRR